MKRYSSYSLPVGHQLGNFRIESVLGEGGFGITYKAWDDGLHQVRAVKEYFPQEIAVRVDGVSVGAKSSEQVENFEWGIEQFRKEARRLTRFDGHPNIVRVRNLFEMNGTAYMVMDYYEGDSLEQRIKERRAPRTEAEILALVRPLLNGLAAVHDRGVLHLDIKPANIYIRSDNRVPLLLDFGAAKDRVAGAQRSRSAGSIYTPGYAALEQYSETGQRGQYTDIYGLGATLYHLVVGVRPDDAPGRAVDDCLRPASEVAAGYYSAEFLTAIDAALRMSGKLRPQNCREWQAMLTAGDPRFADLAAAWEPETRAEPVRIQPIAPRPTAVPPLETDPRDATRVASGHAYTEAIEPPRAAEPADGEDGEDGDWRSEREEEGYEDEDEDEESGDYAAPPAEFVAPGPLLSLAAWVAITNLTAQCLLLIPSVASAYDRLIPTSSGLQSLALRMVLASSLLAVLIWVSFEAGVRAFERRQNES